jgi:hypothetical protein
LALTDNMTSQGTNNALLLGVFALKPTSTFDDNLNQIQQFTINAIDPKRILIGTGAEGKVTGFLYESRDGGYSFEALKIPAGTLADNARVANPSSTAGRFAR